MGFVSESLLPAATSIQKYVDQITEERDEARLERDRASVERDQALDELSQASLELAPQKVLAKPDLTKITGTNWSTVVDPQRGTVGRALLPANRVGGASGVNVFLPLTERVDEAEFFYDICFPADFDWNGGGKTPGLCATLPGGSPSKATGCDSLDNDASYRGMWNGTRGGWSSTIGTRPNLSNAYVYRATPPGETNPKCGEDNFGNKIQWVSGWQTVRGVMGLKSEVLELEISGTQVVRRTDYSWRRDPNVKISHLVISIFRGGSQVDKFASTKPAYVLLDNVLVKGR
jgi:hypothetical protein